MRKSGLRQLSFFFGAGALVFGMSACGVSKEFHDMGAATTSMPAKIDETNKTADQMETITSNLATTTDSMAKTAQQVNESTQQLLNIGASAYPNLRQGGAAAARETDLTAMDQVKSVEGKASQAAQYFQAFEYQLQQPTDADFNSPEARDALYFQAVKQFFSDVDGFISGGGLLSHDIQDIDAQDVSGIKTDNNSRNLYALAITMEMENENEILVDKKAKIRPVSMLSLIEGALSRKSLFASGKEHEKEYESVVLSQEEKAIYMLRLRATFSPMASLAKLTGIDHKSIFGEAGMLFGDYAVDLSAENADQLKYAAIYFKNGNDARSFLDKIGIDPKIDSKVVTFVRHMQLTGESELESGKSTSEQQVKYMNSLLGDVSRFLSANAAI